MVNQFVDILWHNTKPIVIVVVRAMIVSTAQRDPCCKILTRMLLSSYIDTYIGSHGRTTDIILIVIRCQIECPITRRPTLLSRHNNQYVHIIAFPILCVFAHPNYPPRRRHKPKGVESIWWWTWTIQRALIVLCVKRLCASWTAYFFEWDGIMTHTLYIVHTFTTYVCNPLWSDKIWSRNLRTNLFAPSRATIHKHSQCFSRIALIRIRPMWPRPQTVYSFQTQFFIVCTLLCVWYLHTLRVNNGFRVSVNG